MLAITLGGVVWNLVYSCQRPDVLSADHVPFFLLFFLKICSPFLQHFSHHYYRFSPGRKAWREADGGRAGSASLIITIQTKKISKKQKKDFPILCCAPYARTELSYLQHFLPGEDSYVLVNPALIARRSGTGRKQAHC